MALHLNLDSLKYEGVVTSSTHHRGVWIEVGIACAFLLGGILGFLGIFLLSILPQWRQLEEYQRTTCVVKDTRIEKAPTGTLYRPEIQIEYRVPLELVLESEESLTQGEPETVFIVWTYDFNTIINNAGFTYPKEEAEQLRHAFQIGRTYYCWYNPHEPQNVVLFCSLTWTNVLALIVPVSLFLLGFGPLIHVLVYHTGCSREQSAHYNDSSISSDIITGIIRLSSDSESMPSSPSIKHIIDSPGVKMKYRLPLESTPIRSLSIILLLCIGWGILTIAFASAAIGGFLDHRPDWQLTIFIFPFVLILSGLIYYLLRTTQRVTAVAPTLLEMDTVPLHCGQTAKVLLIQFGAHYFFKLDVNLVCEEEAVFSYGTDIRDEKSVVYNQTLLSEHDFNIVSDERFEKSFDLIIPDDAMHSFDAPHNRIVWRLEVYGEPENIPPFTRRFVLVVQP